MCPPRVQPLSVGTFWATETCPDFLQPQLATTLESASWTSFPSNPAACDSCVHGHASSVSPASVTPEVPCVMEFGTLPADPSSLGLPWNQLVRRPWPCRECHRAMWCPQARRDLQIALLLQVTLERPTRL